MSVLGIGIGHTEGHAPGAQGGLGSAIRPSHQLLSIPVQSGASQPGILSTSHGAPLSTPRAGFIKMKEEKQRKKLFANDLRGMMYGFGDHESPLPETIDVLSDVVSDFMLNLTKNAVEMSEKKGKGKKLSVENIIFLVRKTLQTPRLTQDSTQHPKMYFRARELIKMEQQLAESRRSNNEDKELLRLGRPK